MPAIKRNVIEAIGWGDIVLRMSHDKTPLQVRKELEEDPDFMAKFRMAFGERRRLYTSDVNTFLSTRAVEATSALEEVGGNSAAIAAVAAKDYINGLISMGQDFDEITKRCMSMLEEALDKFEENKAAGIDGKDNPFPFGLWEMVRKSMATSTDTGKKLASDPKMQGIVKAGTVNVNNGMTTEQIHATLFDVGHVLGVSEQQMMEAYTKVLMNRKHRKDRGLPIDTEAIPPPPPRVVARMPFIRQTEEKLGMPVQDIDMEPAGGYAA